MDITPRRRRAFSTFLAVLLAVESVSAVAAAAQVNVASRTDVGPAVTVDHAAAGRAAPAGDAAAAARALTRSTSTAPAGAGVPDLRLPDPATAVVADPAVPAPGTDPPRPERVAVKPVAKPSSDKSSGSKAGKSPKSDKSPKSGKAAGAASPADYAGRNHVWIPSLRINRSVSWFSCDRKRPPDNYVYRWGCAGSNNVYLLGHAYSVFEPLHDAYTGGRLRKGMKAYYADARGKLHVYAVRWWKVTLPTTSASWAWAAQDVPSMTLQTCVGANSKYRLMVRLVEVDA